jgi:hypothetical protein
MAILFADVAETNQLVDENTVPLTDEPTPQEQVVVATPLFLAYRLRLHAVLFWGTILLMQMIP